jgi:hypothetical protein
MKSILFLLLLIATISHAAPDHQEGAAYISEYEKEIPKHVFLAQCIELFTGLPASIQLAQAFCETGFGRPDTVGFFDKKLGRVRYMDTIGYHYSNIFSIMDFEGDYWKFGNNKALNWDGTKTYTWRWYLHPVFSWFDHAYYMQVHHSGHCFKPWSYWIVNPVRYGHKGYWKTISKTIQKYRLDKYDLR